MLNKIGRLDTEAKKELSSLLEKIFKLLDENKKDKAEKKIYSLAKTPNYFIREFVGAGLLNYSDQRKIMPIARRMLKHKIYGIRATAFFYLYNRYLDDSKKILALIDECAESIPWEVESIINEMWKQYPDLMKEKMKKWIETGNEKKRALSFHGMENISQSDPNFIMEFISKAIDDETLEVQKKITHILTQVARANPAIVFPYIREWLIDADEKRIKTIWVSMKKLANIVVQRNQKNKSYDFVLLTGQTINDWKNDENEIVATMGKKLSRIINRKIY
ncbi:MAG: DNA alkylation repair protein [Candidatus Cloacimonetes bacterium]|nr:DNA alkylation repair protein [Candidatus Cloacimonadota bacterium]